MNATALELLQEARDSEVRINKLISESKRYEALINLIRNDRRISADAAESYTALIREMDAAAIRARGNGRELNVNR